MKLFVNKKIFDHKGDLILQEDGKAGVKLGTCCVQALLHDTQEDQNAEFSKKIHKWNVARSIQKAMDDEADDAFVELPSEDFTLIKTRVGKSYGTKLVAPICNALEA